MGFALLESCMEAIKFLNCNPSRYKLVQTGLVKLHFIQKFGVTRPKSSSSHLNLDKDRTKIVYKSE